MAAVSVTTSFSRILSGTTREKMRAVLNELNERQKQLDNAPELRECSVEAYAPTKGKRPEDYEKVPLSSTEQITMFTAESNVRLSGLRGGCEVVVQPIRNSYCGFFFIPPHDSVNATGLISIR